MPQIQYLLEVCDLHVADFVQYRPAAVFGKQTFTVTTVRREPRWFKVYRPLIDEFLSVLKYYQTNRDALDMLKEDYSPKWTLFSNMPLYAKLWEPLSDKLRIDSKYVDSMCFFFQDVLVLTLFFSVLP